MLATESWCGCEANAAAAGSLVGSVVCALAEGWIRGLIRSRTSCCPSDCKDALLLSGVLR